MTNTYRQRIEELCHAALDRAAHERADFVREQCGENEALRQEVESLLAQSSNVEGFNEVLQSGVTLGASRVELIGRQIGAYRVLSLLGFGGMGEVYRARDIKLGRDVALKMLPPIFVADREQLARFEREARVLATLNHPHIGGIYGLEESGGAPVLVLELVEGATLAERLQRGRLPVADARSIATQIAGALEGAHERGIIHRDLKPANIKITPDGVVKVLDFGLAKALNVQIHESGRLASAASTVGETGEGTILGTAAYMSPEQARGQATDKRSDIWAFGCVLFEMLTGTRPFEGAGVADVQAAIIRAEPNWDALPADTPPSIRRLLRRCLEKDRKHRLADIADAQLEMDDADRAAEAGAVAAKPSGRRVAALAAVLITTSALSGAMVWVMRPTAQASAPTTRLTLSMPPAASYAGEEGGELAISPDGTRLVFAAFEAGQRRLYVRAFDELEAQPIAGTDGASDPFFSPDGRWVGFFVNSGRVTGTLKKVAVRGGPAITVCDAPGPHGASWAEDDTIIFGASDRRTQGVLRRVSAAGGAPITVPVLDANKREVRPEWPTVLPGGRAILFAIRNEDSARAGGIAVLPLDNTGAARALLPEGNHPRYSPSGHVVYTVGGELMAVPFDLERLETSGSPVRIAEGILHTILGGASFGVSNNGLLVYATGAPGAQRALTWVDRTGREEAITAPLRAYVYPRVSPDGTRVALDVRDQRDDIWVWDLARRTLTPVTTDDTPDRYPVWTPDAQRLLFGSARPGFTNLYVQAADGSGEAVRLTTKPTTQVPLSITPDGTRVLLMEADPQTGLNLEVLTLADRRLAPLLHSQFNETNAVVSPDGRWLAYQSDDSGAMEIYVRPFPDVGREKQQVSTGGGTRPVWARNGRELFYLTGANTGAVGVIAVPIAPAQGFAPGDPEKLFEGRYLASDTYIAASYDVAAEGDRFLMIKDGPGSSTSSSATLIVVSNWVQEMKQLASRPAQ